MVRVVCLLLVVLLVVVVSRVFVFVNVSVGRMWFSDIGLSSVLVVLKKFCYGMFGCILCVVSR